MPVENKFGGSVEFDVKALTSAGEFEGYASIFGNIDMGGDIVAPGAFTETLRNLPASKIKMLFQHDRSRPIGVWDEASIDAKGLYVKGHLILSTADGKNSYELIKAGAMDGLSIGYRATEDSYDRTTDVRTLLKVNLYEVSVVTFPMNTEATIDNVKNIANKIGAITTLSEVETLLRDAGGNFSRKQAMALVSVVKSISQRDAAAKSEIKLLDKIKKINAKFNAGSE